MAERRDGLGFTLKSLESVAIVFQNPGTPGFLILEGVGTLSGAGFDDTAATWSLSANQAGDLFNFSAGTTTSVPEAGSALLLLSAMALGRLARRRAS